MAKVAPNIQRTTVNAFRKNYDGTALRLECTFWEGSQPRAYCVLVMEYTSDGTVQRETMCDTHLHNAKEEDVEAWCADVFVRVQSAIRREFRVADDEGEVHET